MFGGDFRALSCVSSLGLWGLGPGGVSAATSRVAGGFLEIAAAASVVIPPSLAQFFTLVRLMPDKMASGMPVRFSRPCVRYPAGPFAGGARSLRALPDPSWMESAESETRSEVQFLRPILPADPRLATPTDWSGGAAILEKWRRFAGTFQIKAIGRLVSSCSGVVQAIAKMFKF